MRLILAAEKLSKGLLTNGKGGKHMEPYKIQAKSSQESRQPMHAKSEGKIASAHLKITDSPFLGVYLGVSKFEIVS